MRRRPRVRNSALWSLIGQVDQAQAPDAVDKRYWHTTAALFTHSVEVRSTCIATGPCLARDALTMQRAEPTQQVPR